MYGSFANAVISVQYLIVKISCVSPSSSITKPIKWRVISAAMETDLICPSTITRLCSLFSSILSVPSPFPFPPSVSHSSPAHVCRCVAGVTPTRPSGFRSSSVTVSTGARLSSTSETHSQHTSLSTCLPLSLCCLISQCRQHRTISTT